MLRASELQRALAKCANAKLAAKELDSYQEQKGITGSGIKSEIIQEFLRYPQHLIHKAAGWMLREAGRRNLAWPREFSHHAADMPRTMPRYSIEKLSETERKKWMSVTAYLAFKLVSPHPT